MNNLKIKGFDNLEKDPESGAILLNQQNDITTIKLDNLMRKVKLIEKQNSEIIEMLKALCNKNNINNNIKDE